MIEIIRLFFSALLLLVSLYFIFTNFRFLLQNYRRGLNAGPAPMTIIGGLSGCLGILILPYGEFINKLSLLWIPLVVDLGCIPFYLTLLVLTCCQALGIRLWAKSPDY